MLEKVFVFGNGCLFKNNISKVNNNYIVEGVLDNSVEENILDNGIRVMNPKTVSLKGKTVLIMIRNFFGAYFQLKKLGVDDNNIIIGINLYGITKEDKMIYENSKVYFEDNAFFVHIYATDERIKVYDIKSLDEIQRKVLRQEYSKNPTIQSIKEFKVYPVSRDFGTKRGTAIDRYFIESFLHDNKDCIKGDVLEIGDNIYTCRYGTEGKYKSHVLHVEGWGDKAIKGNFETGEGLIERTFDTLIITQTLNFIYDLKEALKTINAILKSGGIGLITVAGISQVSRYDADRWGDYWRFNLSALEKLFYNEFGRENVEINQYGNVKLACAMLYGMCQEEMDSKDFEIVDEDYPMIFTIKVKKR